MIPLFRATPQDAKLARTSPRLNRRLALGLAAAVAASTLLLTWLFIHADAVPLAEHDAYRRELRDLAKLDTELDAAVLSSRFGVTLNYDGVAARTAALAQLGARLGNAPAFLEASDRDRLARELAAYRDQHAHKSALVERFKRMNAVLRNSLPVFPLLVDRTLASGALDHGLSDTLNRYALDVLGHNDNSDAQTALQLERHRSQLLEDASRLPREAETALRNIVAHGDIIISTKPPLEALTRDIITQPTAAMVQGISDHYAQAYQRASIKAGRYRQLLYVASLLLASYLAIAILRLARTSGALASSNRTLATQLDALNRTQSELRLLANVFTNAAEGMVITDSSGRILAINPAFTRITGYRLEEVQGQKPAILASGRQDAGFYAAMWSALTRSGKWQGEIWNRSRGGTVYPEWLSISAVHDADGRASHYIGIFTDISERKSAEAHINHLAHHDALTGLPNRLLLQDRLQQALIHDKRNGNHTAVLFMDLDRFKNINDTLGHEIGDQLLMKVAERCRTALRESDTISRQGGDEFVIVLPDLAHPRDAGIAAEKILAALQQPFALGQHTLTVTGSIGIALHPEDGESASALLRNADAAMYRAKANGRNGHAFYAKDMTTTTLGTLLIENELRGAIDRDELELHYQPKFSAASGQLTGVEALIRWRHPERGLLTPAHFITIAEESGLIVQIGAWVLRRACAQMRRWLDEGCAPASVAVNLAATQLREENIVSLVRQTLEAFALPPGCLELELTETLLMQDAERAITMLAELRTIGVSFAIDDFGTGYSSLAYLRQFPVQTLKIDRSFVSDLHPGDAEDKIVPAIIALAHGLGMRVVAEGVETPFQAEYLRERQCDDLQGFLLSRPVPAGEIAGLVRQAMSASAS